MSNENKSDATDSANKPEKKETKLEFMRSLIFALILALLFRSLLFEPFYIPSGSMKSTLIVGDYVFVKKYEYGYSRFSFPFGNKISSKTFEGRKFGSEPKRGDAVVFKLPTNTKINYIKRLIGLPGDEIQVRNGFLYINGKKIKKERIEDFIEKDSFGNDVKIPQYIETLPNGVQYKVLDMTFDGLLDNTKIYKVPDNHYFMMGDNRDNSVDSRVLDQVGYVPVDNLLGPARLIFFSAKEPFWKFWKWPVSIRFSRLLDAIDMKGDVKK